MRRSVSTDLELDPGTYSVLMKITAKRWKSEPIPVDVIRQNVRSRQNKLIQIGLSYDLAHAKGEIRESELEKQERKMREEKKRAEEKKKQRMLKRRQNLADWEFERRKRAREKRQNAKREAFERKKVAKAKTAEEDGGQTNGDDSAKTAIGADAGAGVEGLIEKQSAAGAKEATTGESAPEPSSMPSPSAEPRSDESKPSDAPPATNTTTQNDKNPPITANSAPDGPAQDAQQFEQALKSIPSVTVNGEPAVASSAANGPQSVAAPSTLAPNDDYQYDSDASFDSSIDSVLDFPREPITDEDVTVEEDLPPPDDDEENKEFEDDPWNAICVVGLRVYSKDPGCCVEAIKPKDEEETLDLDDASKGASGEVEGAADGVKNVKIDVKK